MHIRQLPSFYMRGAIANQTMKNLTPAECEQVNELVTYIANHDKMQGHLHKYHQQLGHTIRSDYAEDINAVKADFQIAIWKGVVELLFHHNYSYICAACNSSTFVTKAKKTRTINRQNPACPNCNCVKISDPGSTDYQIGQYVNADEFQNSYINFTAGQQTPQSESPIIAVKGTKKYNNAAALLADENQLLKFFREFAWGYFKQQISENQRVTHNAEVQEVTGPADEIIVELILELCTKHGVKVTYYRNLMPERGYYRIYIPRYKTPPEFSIGLVEIVQLGKLNGVRFVLDESEIKVAEDLSLSTITAAISKPEYVVMQSGVITNEDDSNTSLIDTIPHKTVKGENVISLNPDIAEFERSDRLAALRSYIPEDGISHHIIDILSQEGPAYDNYTKEFGTSKPKMANIAKLYNRSIRDIKRAKSNIQILMLAFYNPDRCRA